MRVLFVCLGNICRSPTAEGVFRRRLEKAGLSEQIEVDSAGTGGWHVGEPPDPRAIDHAGRRGYDLRSIRARQVSADDFEAFDYILAMDEANRRELMSKCPQHLRCRVRLFLDYAEDPLVREVPDPYYGGADGFSRVLDLIETASDGLIRELQGQLRSSG